MAEFQARTVTHADGREREVTTQRDLVAARFDGFTELTSGQKAARTRAAKKTTTKRTAKKAASTSVSPTEAPKGGPAATPTSAPAKTAAATQTPA